MFTLGGAALLAAAAVLVLVVGPVGDDDDAPDLVAAAWLPLWDPRAAASLATAVDVGGVSEVSPTWASVQLDGALALNPPTSRVRAALASGGVRVIPVVQNFADGAWQGDRIAELLADPDWVEEHRAALVDTARAEGWHGVDIDYEALPPEAGADFVDFLRALADDLHRHDLVLSVAVPAREADDDPGTLAYSYQMIGQVADQVRLMAYDHSWSGSEAGSVAPVAWVRSVVDYAVTRVPREKLMLGVATYGYDWVGDEGRSLTAADALALARRMDGVPLWDDAAGSMTFEYVDDAGGLHTVWYEDARSLAVKQQVAADTGLRGVAIWALGGEDPAAWTVLAERTAP